MHSYGSFLPPNTILLLQPMDQGVIVNFKAYYLGRTFSQLIKANEGWQQSIKVLWKVYNIMKAINNIGVLGKK